MIFTLQVYIVSDSYIGIVSDVSKINLMNTVELIHQIDLIGSGQ